MAIASERGEKQNNGVLVAKRDSISNHAQRSVKNITDHSFFASQYP